MSHYEIKEYEITRNGGLQLVDATAGAGLPVGTVLHWGGNMGYAARDYCILSDNSNGYWCYDLDHPDQNAHLKHVGYSSVKRQDDPDVWHSQHFFVSERTVPAEQLTELLADHERQATAKTEAEEKAEAERQELEDTGRKLWADLMPEDTDYVIVAERRVDDSDPMTDYFHAHTEETVILAPSRHGRNLFSEMRKAATRIPETAHLGPGCDRWTARVVLCEDLVDNGTYYTAGQPSPWHRDLYGNAHRGPTFETEAAARNHAKIAGPPESIQFQTADGPRNVDFRWDFRYESVEHRENYSGGSGYYLHAGPGRGGWHVRKTACRPLRYNADTGKHAPHGDVPRNLLIAYARRHDHLTPKKRAKKTPKAASSTTTATAQITEHTHTTKGFQMWIVSLSARVDRGTFDTLLSRAKSAGGWYSRPWKGTPGGFAFKAEEATRAFAAEL
jgi:hypothetical protein